MKTKSKVLIIEDEKDVSKLIKYSFFKNGFEVIAAYDGEKGLELAKTESPDLIMLDLMLPKIEGYEVLQQLKDNSATAKIPVIILSAKISPGAIIKGFRLGVSDYVPKPFNIGELIIKVKEQLNKENKGGDRNNTEGVNTRNNSLTKDFYDKSDILERLWEIIGSDGYDFDYDIGSFNNIESTLKQIKRICSEN